MGNSTNFKGEKISMKNLMVGMIYNEKYINLLTELNKEFELTKISAVYGSIRERTLGSSRPTYRLPDVSKEEFATYVKKLNQIGVKFFYTANAMVVGPLSAVKTRLKDIYAFVDWLREIGVNNIIVANPLYLQILRDKYPDLYLEASTIMRVRTITQIDALIKRGINKICLDIYKNRDFNFLARAQKLAHEYGVTLEVITNEFCDWQCLDRNSCYIQHSITEDDEHAVLKNYPMCNCIWNRSTKKGNWLRTPFILPEWLDDYTELTGINHFKVTGRTGTLEFMAKILSYYLRGSECFLEDLWFHLQNIWLQEKTMKPGLNIQSKDLKGFLNYFITRNPDCERICKVDCNWCFDFLR